MKEEQEVRDLHKAYTEQKQAKNIVFCISVRRVKMAEYIDRDSALEALMYAMCGTGYQSLAMSEIRIIPVADVAPVVHGQWIKGVPVGLWDKPDGYRCSNCGTVILGMPPSYCQRCGAKMDMEEPNGE